MPLGDMSNLKFGIMVDGKFREIENNIREITLAPEYEVIESFKAAGYKDEEFSISFKAKNIDFKRMIRNVIYGSNNWRKMHGVPMIRKFGSKK